MSKSIKLNVVAVRINKKYVEIYEKKKCTSRELNPGLPRSTRILQPMAGGNLATGPLVLMSGRKIKLFYSLYQTFIFLH